RSAARRWRSARGPSARGGSSWRRPCGGAVATRPRPCMGTESRRCFWGPGDW
ncbi:unnamed protein product, partial [Symbiodinium sp. CCMP2456]